MSTSANTIDTVARTAWGEARGCGQAGMQAVINVIVNRAHHPCWWGHDLSSVCTEPYQFSCRNANDPNRAKLFAVTTSDPEFRIALSIATSAVENKLPDITNGADSYYALSMTYPPAWAERGVEVYRDHWHVFFRIEGPAQRTATPAAPQGAPQAPCVSVHAVTTNDLNTESLDGTLNL